MKLPYFPYALGLILITNCTQDNVIKGLGGSANALILITNYTPRNFNQDTSITWISYSHFTGDTNIVVDLPNIIKLKSSIQFPCQGDPERLIMNYTSLINKDTSYITVVSSIFSIYLPNDEAKDTKDTTWFARVRNNLMMLDTTTRINFKKVIVKNKRYTYVIKYTIDEIPYYGISLRYRTNGFKISIKNIKDDAIVNRMINSIKFEEQQIFLCI